MEPQNESMVHLQKDDTIWRCTSLLSLQEDTHHRAVGTAVGGRLPSFEPRLCFPGSSSFWLSTGGALEPNHFGPMGQWDSSNKSPSFCISPRSCPRPAHTDIQVEAILPRPASRGPFLGNRLGITVSRLCLGNPASSGLFPTDTCPLNKTTSIFNSAAASASCKTHWNANQWVNEPQK